MKIEDAIDSHIHLNLANARGDVWYALGKVTACAAELYTLLQSLRVLCGPGPATSSRKQNAILVVLC